MAPKRRTRSRPKADRRGTIQDVARFLADPKREPISDFGAWAETHAAEDALAQLEGELRNLELRAAADSPALVMAEQGLRAIEACRADLAHGNAACVALSMRKAVDQVHAARFALELHAHWLSGKRSDDAGRLGGRVRGGARLAARFKGRDLLLIESARMARTKGLTLGQAAEALKKNSGSKMLPGVERLKRIIAPAFKGTAGDPRAPGLSGGASTRRDGPSFSRSALK